MGGWPRQRIRRARPPGKVFKPSRQKLPEQASAEAAPCNSSSAKLAPISLPPSALQKSVSLEDGNRAVSPPAISPILCFASAFVQSAERNFDSVSIPVSPRKP